MEDNVKYYSRTGRYGTFICICGTTGYPTFKNCIFANIPGENIRYSTDLQNGSGNNLQNIIFYRDKYNPEYNTRYCNIKWV